MESSSLSGTSELIINVPGNKINANDYAIHLYVYTLFIYIDKGIMRKFGVE